MGSTVQRELAQTGLTSSEPWAEKGAPGSPMDLNDSSGHPLPIINRPLEATKEDLRGMDDTLE
eukprot:5290838-Lingulodinium_polyedra.AAC.1